MDYIKNLIIYFGIFSMEMIDGFRSMVILKEYRANGPKRDAIKQVERLINEARINIGKYQSHDDGILCDKIHALFMYI